MTKITYIGIRKGSDPFRVVNAKLLKNDLNSLPAGRYRLTVERWRKGKSNPQLGYLFAVIYPLVLQHLIDAGWEFTSVEEVDAYCKSRFANREIVNRDTAEIISVPALKRDFTTTDMMTYINAIRQWDAEYLGGTIPEPETNFEIQYK
jgi:hypothetical protein